VNKEDATKELQGHQEAFGYMGKGAASVYY